MDETGLPIDTNQISSLLNFTASGIISGLLFGIIGMYVFKEGRKRLNFRVTFLGIAMMVYPYFTKGPWGDWGVGVALCAATYYFWQE